MRLNQALIAASLLLALPLAAGAADRGVNEVSGSLTYTDIGDASTTNIDLAYGRYLTEQHEVGMTFGYVDADFDGLGSVDGTTIGAFYQFNFDSGISVAARMARGLAGSP